VIPKRISFFWGGEMMSWLRYMTLFSFRILHPDWKMYLYMGSGYNQEKPWEGHNTSDFLEYQGPDYSDRVGGLDVEVVPFGNLTPNRAATSVHMSDVFEWWVLGTHGGLYSDMDILYIRPIDEWFERVRDNHALVSFFNNHFSIGFLGACEGCSFYRELERICYTHYSIKAPNDYQGLGIHVITELMRNVHKVALDKVDTLRLEYPEIVFHNISKELVYPYDSESIIRIHGPAIGDVLSETCGIHWYGGHPISQQANSILNEVTVKQGKSIICRQVTRLLEGR